MAGEPIAPDAGEDLHTSPVARCPNCDTEITGPFCAGCGQQQSHLQRPIWSLAGELLEDLFRLDSRVLRTLFVLLFKPGHLTTEHFAGRRARYTPPVRLYLVISFLFFFLMSGISGIDATVLRSEEPTVQLDKGSLDLALQDLDLPWLDETSQQALGKVFEEQVNKSIKLFEENPSALFNQLMDLLSAAMFFMLPVFTVFLKLLYLGSGVYYAEHLLLAVHNHCFLFLALLLSTLIERITSTWLPLDSLIELWIPVYIFLSLKFTYQQSYWLTSIKFLILLFTYLALASAGILAAAIVGILTL